ncbi:MAG: hypothetical protein Q9226_006356 [Calogaya cf. arnoldii]
MPNSMAVTSIFERGEAQVWFGVGLQISPELTTVDAKWIFSPAGPAGLIFQTFRSRHKGSSEQQDTVNKPIDVQLPGLGGLYAYAFENQMTSKPYNVGIIGYGAAAKVFHIPLIEVASELNLYAIVQRHPTPENDASNNHPGIKSYRAAEEIVKDEAVHIVVITTTPATHFELAKLALENGKHVLVEKPFVPTTSEADELIALAKKHDSILTVYQNRRFDTDFLTLKALLGYQTLGRIVEFESHFDRYKPTFANSKPWKTVLQPGGGAIYDLGAHLIDQIVHLSGLPKRITGFLGSQRAENPGGYDDSCTVLMHYADGMIATVKVAVISPEKEQLRFWVRGEKGSYKKYHEDSQEAHLTSGMRPGDAGFGIEPEDRHGTLTILENNTLTSKPHPTVQPTADMTYKIIYEQLAAAVAGKGDVAVKAEEAREVIRLIELAKKSSGEGRTLDV